ncbi:MAG TPA: 30S ribosomal protein S2 [Candidatus Brocadiia bacterium]|nr:30S ribosomal protein S2 [Candidatus Brocadiia bacterium]
MAKPTMRDLLKAGLHYGHRASRWNPRMAPFIFGKRNLIHIINLRETMRGLITARRFVSRIVSMGQGVLFVGTKRHARNTIKAEALRCNMHFVSERWLGGTLTNFRYIRSRLGRLFDLEELFDSGAIFNYSKKEASLLRREKDRIHRNLEGIRNMEELPGAVFVVDPHREKNAVAEARRAGIPTICLADTDCDPDDADILIPGNDDAMRAVELVARQIADAVIEGQEKRQAQDAVQPLAPRPATVPAGGAAPTAEAGPAPAPAN